MFRNGEAASLEYPSTGDATLTGVSFHNGRFVQARARAGWAGDGWGWLPAAASVRRCPAWLPRAPLTPGAPQRLRARAASAPGVTLRCGTAVGLLGRGGGAWGGAPGEPVGGVAYKPAAASAPSGAGAAPHPPAPLRALGRLTVVCDGMYSSLRAPLRGGPALADIAAPSFFVGLVLRGAPSELLPTPGRAAVVLARAAPVLFYPISSTEVRCLVDVPGGALPAAGTGALRAHLAGLSSQLPDGPLRAAYDAAVATGGARSVQNRTLASAPLAVPGALLLGDSANMRHPLTGGGMTVALCDCSLLCELLSGVDLAAEAASSALLAPSRAPAWHAAYFARRKPWAATINTLAGALYAVFSAAGGAAWGEEMRAACFDYLRLGGACARGPVSLLSGLNPRPGVLVLHFFSVALFGVGRLLLPVPTPRACLLGARLLLGAAAIILPIIRAEGLAAVFLPPPPAPDSGAAGAKQA